MFRRRILQVGLLSFVTAALALPAQAVGFSAANLKGSYSFLVNRWTADAGRQEFALVGVLTFDGVGNVTGSGTAVTGGVSLSGALGGTYSVSPNGTGAINFTTLFLGGTAQLAFTLNSTTAGVCLTALCSCRPTIPTMTSTAAPLCSCPQPRRRIA